MATNIGTGPQDIPLNQFLGEMAFMDNIFEDGDLTNLGLVMALIHITMVYLVNMVELEIGLSLI